MAKKSSGIKRGIGQSRTKKAIAVLNKRAVELGIAKEADFTGLDVSVAEEMITAIRETREMFPELPPLDYVSGTAQVERRTGVQYTPSKETIGVFTGMDHNTGGRSGVPVGIAVNEANDRRSLLKELKNDVDMHQFHPEGCYTIKSMVDHEIGHWLTIEIGAARDKKIMSLYRKHKDALDFETSPTGEIMQVKRSMKSVLSGYARTNQFEFIAEAWSEYRNNPHPRPVALEVGQRIEKLYREGHEK